MKYSRQCAHDRKSDRQPAMEPLNIGIFDWVALAGAFRQGSNAQAQGSGIDATRTG
jgi:hypothetical protein